MIIVTSRDIWFTQRRPRQGESAREFYKRATGSQRAPRSVAVFKDAGGRAVRYTQERSAK